MLEEIKRRIDWYTAYFGREPSYLRLTEDEYFEFVSEVKHWLIKKEVSTDLKEPKAFGVEIRR